MKPKYFTIIPIALLLLITAIILIYVNRGKNQRDVSDASSSEITEIDFSSLTNGNNSCEGINMISSSPDSPDEIRCFSRPLGYILIKKVGESEYQCTDSLGSGLNINLKYSYEIPEYCDNNKAVLVLMKELNISILELQKLAQTDDVSVENQEKFKTFVSTHQQLITLTLALDPYNDTVIKAVNDFYHLLREVGIQGTSQDEIDSQIRKAQQVYKFKT